MSDMTPYIFRISLSGSLCDTPSLSTCIRDGMQHDFASRLWDVLFHARRLTPLAFSFFLVRPYFFSFFVFRVGAPPCSRT